jgi:hypothetical protein
MHATAIPASPAPWRPLGFGEWDLDNVYAFVYEVAMEVDTEGRDLAALVGEMDFPVLLLAAADDRR